MLIPMEVIGVRVEMPSNQPIVLLKVIDGTRFLAIWVGAVKATAIALAVRTHSNIRATEELLNEVGVEIPRGEGDNEEVEKFREFLDQINPEDFAG